VSRSAVQAAGCGIGQTRPPDRTDAGASRRVERGRRSPRLRRRSAWVPLGGRCSATACADLGAAQRLPLRLAGGQATAQQPAGTTDVLDLPQDRLLDLPAHGVAGLAGLAVEPGVIAARNPSPLDCHGLPWGCRKTHPRHAAWAYSWISPPKRSSRTTRMSAGGAAAEATPSGAACPSARCGRCWL